MDRGSLTGMSDLQRVGSGSFQATPSHSLTTSKSLTLSFGVVISFASDRKRLARARLSLAVANISNSFFTVASSRLVALRGVPLLGTGYHGALGALNEATSRAAHQGVPRDVPRMSSLGRRPDPH